MPVSAISLVAVADGRGSTLVTPSLVRNVSKEKAAREYCGIVNYLNFPLTEMDRTYRQVIVLKLLLVSKDTNDKGAFYDVPYKILIKQIMNVFLNSSVYSSLAFGIW